MTIAAQPPRRRKTWSDAVTALLKLGKAVDPDFIDDLADKADIFDRDDRSARWEDIRSPASARTLGISAGADASGDGGAEMAARYADPVATSGNQNDSDKLGKMLEMQGEMLKGLRELAAAIKGSDEATDDNEDEDEAMRGKSKSEILVDKAERALRAGGIAEIEVKDLIEVIRGATALRRPPDFLEASALRKAQTDSANSELMGRMTPAQLNRWLEAKQLVSASNRGVAVHKSNLHAALATLRDPLRDAQFSDAVETEISQQRLVSAFAQRGVNVDGVGGDHNLPRR